MRVSSSATYVPCKHSASHIHQDFWQLCQTAYTSLKIFPCKFWIICTSTKVCAGVFFKATLLFAFKRTCCFIPLKKLRTSRKITSSDSGFKRISNLYNPSVLTFKKWGIIYFWWNRVAQLSANRILRAKGVGKALIKEENFILLFFTSLETIN